MVKLALLLVPLALIACGQSAIPPALAPPATVSASPTPPPAQLAPLPRTPCPPGNPIRTPPSALPGTGGCP